MIISIIALSIVVVILALLVVAHATANKDDRAFTSNTGGKIYDRRGIVNDSLVQWKSTTKVYFDEKKQRPKQKPSLKQLLKIALENEEYETAAKLRDQINKKSKQWK